MKKGAGGKVPTQAQQSMLEKVMMKRIIQKDYEAKLIEAGLQDAPQQVKFKFKCDNF